MDTALSVWTIGHSTRPIDEFVAALQSFRIAALVDVRTYPGSRRYPQFNKPDLAASRPFEKTGAMSHQFSENAAVARQKALGTRGLYSASQGVSRNFFARAGNSHGYFWLHGR